jgi:phospholipase D-like protein
MSNLSTRSHKRFRQLPVRTQLALLALAAAQLALLVWAQVDIHRRSDDEIAGPKLGWRLACLINFVGPLSYLRWGRKRKVLVPPAEAGQHRPASRHAPANRNRNRVSGGVDS